MINNKTYFTQFIVLVGVIVLAFAAAQLISVIVFFGGGGTLSDMMDAANMENIGLMKVMQIVAQLIIFLVPVAVFSKLKTGSYIKYPLFKNPKKVGLLLFSLLVLAVSFPFIGSINLWNQSIEFPEALKGIESILRSLEDQAMEMTEAFMKMDNVGDLLVNIVMIGFLAGLGEELLFRGTIQHFLSEWTKKPHFAIILSAFIFSLIHLQFYGFFPRWLLGILFGYLYYWSGTIWIPVIAHALFNGLQVVGFYFAGDMESFNMDNMEALPWYITLASLAGLIFVMWYFHQYCLKSNSIINYEQKLEEDIQYNPAS